MSSVILYRQPRSVFYAALIEQRNWTYWASRTSWKSMDTKDLPRAFDLRKELEARRNAARRRVAKKKQAEDGGQQSLF
jgi:hypothetical protein